MNLFYSNHSNGEYPVSWYSATCDLLPENAIFDSVQQADVCIVGAGHTGLSAGLHLVKPGFKVVVLKA